MVLPICSGRLATPASLRVPRAARPLWSGASWPRQPSGLDRRCQALV